MARLPATTTPLNMTATMDVDASVNGQPNLCSQNLASFNSHTPRAQPSPSTTIPRNILKNNQTDDEQSGVKYGPEAVVNKNNQTDDEQFEVGKGNEAVGNKNSQTDHEQSSITNGQETRAKKPVSQITVTEQH